MATLAGTIDRPKAVFAPDWYERLLSGGAMILLIAGVTAIARGRAGWDAVPPLVWVHLATVLIAVALTPVMLLRPRGNAAHRLFGKVWLLAMLATAASTFWVRTSGGYSVIHILSVWTLFQVPFIWITARRHQVARHRRLVRGLVTGALLIAGFFTFPFDRMLGHWLFA